jgi:glycosyltransferase involved in cell wall biosynthesis
MEHLLENGFYVRLVIYEEIYFVIKEKLDKYETLEIDFIPQHKNGILRRIIRKLNLGIESIFTKINLLDFDFVIISQGGSYEIVNDRYFCNMLINQNIDYYIISQFHEEYGYLDAEFRRFTNELFNSSNAVFYTSKRNLEASKMLLSNYDFTSVVVGNPLRFPILNRDKVFNKEIIKIITVGRLNVDLKGQNLLIEALARINKEFEFWELSILGMGPHIDYLKDLVVSNNLKQKVHFLGFHENVSEYLDESDIFILPSISEGQSLALLEALSRGLVVIATDTGGAKEIINENNGYIISGININSIERTIRVALLENEKWQYISENARNTMKDINMVDAVKKVITTIERKNA